MCHMSRITCQVSGVRCQVTHIFILYIFFLQSCGASRWKVCYQRGLPRPVLTVTSDKNRKRQKIIEKGKMLTFRSCRRHLPFRFQQFTGFFRKKQAILYLVAIGGDCPTQPLFLPCWHDAVISQLWTAQCSAVLCSEARPWQHCNCHSPCLPW